MSAPDDLPRPPAGRTPRWALDEARRAAAAEPRGPGDRVGAPAPAPSAASPGPAAAVSWGVQGVRPRRGRRLVPALVVLLVAAPLAVQVVRWAGAHPDLAAVWDSLTASPGEMRALGGPPPGQGEAPSPIGTPPAVDPAGAPYAFSATQVVDGAQVPVAWSPCRPIRYVVNPTGAPDGFVDTVRRVMAELTAATGLQLLDVGATDEPVTTDRDSYQPDRYGDRWAPVLIGFADESAEPVLAGDVAGVGGAASAARRDGTRVYVSGAVVLDAASLGDSTMPDGTPVWVATLRHEVAHVLGLDHVDDTTQLMHPRRSFAVTTFQAGDRAGLAALGRGVCAPDL